MLVERIVELGARPAQPGEFTARAFLNGAIDLTRAEAVSDIINARSDAQLRSARRMMDGRLTERTEHVLETLAELVALVEADIDFAEEPIDFISPEDLLTRVSHVERELEQLIAAAESTDRLDVLPHILLVGRSNAGKSTLMNALSGMDRAICSPVGGTTRDVLSVTVMLGQVEVMLLDAAGVDTESTDLLREAADLTLAAAGRVDLILYVVDLTGRVDDAFPASIISDASPPTIIIANKIDALGSEVVERRITDLKERHGQPVCPISALHGRNLDALKHGIVDAMDAPSATVGDEVVLVTARQREAIQSALECVRRCRETAAEIDETIDQADILAFDLREALEQVGSVAGSVTTEDLLGRVFASFCIGK